MITIALDEQGDFENLKGELRTEPVFIGGIIYDDAGDRDDYETEKRRLQQYFKSACAKAGVRYPKDLHFTTEGSSGNGAKVKAFKTLFGNTVKEFLEDGTFEGNDLDASPRKGHYYIFASLRGDNGKEDLLTEDVSLAVREDFAGNLYLHMAEDVVERIVFHNPIVKDIKEVRLELATRRVILNGEDRAVRMKEYEKLGYTPEIRPKEQRQTGTIEYVLTNPANYRTAFEREMLKSGKKAIMIDRIGVKSINYDYARNGMDFLYMADAICSYLSFNKKGNTPHEWIASFDTLSEGINGKRRNLIWGYDEADDYFDMGLKALERGDLFEALSLSYDGARCAGSMREYYCKRWYPLLERAVVEGVNASNLAVAIKIYKDAVMINNNNPEKLAYIFDGLKKAGECVNYKNKEAEAELYNLYDAGVSVYTHVGDLKNAKKCFEKCLEYAEYVATEIFLRTRNRMAVFYCNRREFGEALKIANENVRYHELLLAMKKEIFNDERYESLNHAIALSQRGQVYAFLKDRRAEEDFMSALSTMDLGTPDRLITESYLLHYYISSGNKEKFEEYAKEYFEGRIEPEEQFDYLIREGVGVHARFSLKFAIFVWVKALYTFYLDSVTNSLVDKLRDIEKTLTDLKNEAEKQINGHPWELIYKYFVLIMLKYKETEAADAYYRKLQTMLDESAGNIKDIATDSLRICNAAKEKVCEPNVSTSTYMFF